MEQRGREGSYINSLIDLMKQDGKTYETRDDILRWAAEVDDTPDHPLKDEVFSIYTKMTSPDKSAWVRFQNEKKKDPIPPSATPPKKKPIDPDDPFGEIPDATGGNIKTGTKSKVIDPKDKDKLASNIDEEDLYKWSKKKA